MEKHPHSYYTIRFGDCDPFGHLNNARYVDYFLNAREDHLKAAYQMDLKQLYNQGLAWFVGSHEISYLKPADYNEMVRITSSLIEAAPEFLLVELVMTDEQQKHVKSVMWTQFIPVDIKTGKRASHPEDFLSFAKSISSKIAEPTFQQRCKAVAMSVRETA